jgi:hypothetical protein
LFDPLPPCPDFSPVNTMDFISMLPFALLLGMMAVAPVVAPSWWSQHYTKTALGLGAIMAVY